MGKLDLEKFHGRRDLEKFLGKGNLENFSQKSMYSCWRNIRSLKFRRKGGKIQERKCEAWCDKYEHVCAKGRKNFSSWPWWGESYCCYLPRGKKYGRAFAGVGKWIFKKATVCVCERGGGAITVSAFFWLLRARMRTSKNTGGHCSIPIGLCGRVQSDSESVGFGTA